MMLFVKNRQILYPSSHFCSIESLLIASPNEEGTKRHRGAWTFLEHCSQEWNRRGRAGLRVLGQDCSDRALHEEAEY